MGGPPTSDDAAGDPVRDLDGLVRRLVDGDLRMHQLPADLPARDAATVRRRAIERIAGVELTAVGSYTLDDERASRQNCENLIGAAQVPIGVAGPLTVRGDHVNGDVWLPLATTEGALIASVNRGCAAVRAAGGAVVRVEDVGMTRAPVFRTRGTRQTREFLDWVGEHEDEIRTVTESTSGHLELLEVRPYALGTTVFLRFRFSTGDAMGMNMTTIACDRAVTDLIEPATSVPCVALSGNVCVDKKPSAMNFLEGRGKRVYAEVVLSPDDLRRLRTNAEELVEVQYRKNLMGSIASRSSGFNAQYANILAALFIATGQDLAHVVEGAMGVTAIEPRDGGSVYASAYMPDLPLAAIGGGTGLGTQQAALRLLGVEVDPERPGAAVSRLAEIVGAAVLAGELSLLAAFTSRDLARAHERLGRAGGGPSPED